MKNLLRQFEEKVKEAKRRGYYPEIPIIQGAATEKKVIVDGKEFRLFSSNNYLGLSSHPEVKNAIRSAVDVYGMGSGGSRLLAGNTDIHNELERTIAEFVGAESAITFSTGYMANVGVIPALVHLPVANVTDLAKRFFEKNILRRGRSDELSIISDEKNHGSIVDGARLSGAEKLIYKHCDMKDLEEKVKKAKGKRKLIVTDGVFSMDGTIAPLPDIIHIAKKHGAMTMVDDAHSIGVLGNNGGGTVEHHGLKPDEVDILMGTFTKAFGGVGGFVVGRKEFIDYLRVTARTHILSAPIPPSIAAGLNTSVQVARKEGWRREKAMENGKYFREKVHALGYSTLGSETLIVPVVFGDEKKAIQATKEMYKLGIIAPNVRFPAVPLGESRLRFVMSAMHDKEDIDVLLEALKVLREKLDL